MLAHVKRLRLLRRNQLAAHADRGGHFLYSHIMPDKAFQVAHLKPVWLKNFFVERRRRLELMQHFRGDLARCIAAHVDPKLLLLLNQQQPHIDSLLEIKSCLFGLRLIIEPVSTAHEIVLQQDFFASIVKILFSDAFAIDRAEIERAPAGAYAAIVGIEKNDERNN